MPEVIASCSSILVHNRLQRRPLQRAVDLARSMRSRQRNPMLRTILIGLIASSSSLWCETDPVIVPPDAQAPAVLRTELVDIANGGELVILFEKLRADAQTDGKTEIPLLAVLKDTMRDADPANDRLRQVWVFTYTTPSVAQRIAAGVPFFYHRSGLKSGSSRRPPGPVFDMARPAHG